MDATNQKTSAIYAIFFAVVTASLGLPCRCVGVVGEETAERRGVALTVSPLRITELLSSSHLRYSPDTQTPQICPQAQNNGLAGLKTLNKQNMHYSLFYITDNHELNSNHSHIRSTIQQHGTWNIGTYDILPLMFFENHIKLFCFSFKNTL